MSQTIIRTYVTPQQATAASAALRQQGFDNEHDGLVVCPGVDGVRSNSYDTSAETVAAEIADCYVGKARAFAADVVRGASLVIVHAPFGRAMQAVDILESFQPIDAGFADTGSHVRPWDEAAPISSALQIPVKLDDATPFSRCWNLPILLDQAAPSTSIGVRTLMGGTVSLSNKLGLPTLASHFSASAALGLPILKQSRQRRSPAGWDH